MMNIFERSGAPEQLETVPYELQIEKLLETDVNIVNEGERGFIACVPEHTYHQFIDEHSDSDVAFKMLKLGTEKSLLQEVTMHKKAQRIIAASGVSPDEIAQIPKLIFERAAIKPRGRLLEWCQKNGHHFDEKMLMFAMDFVPGSTLGEILLREVLVRHKDSMYAGGAHGVSELAYPTLAAAAEQIFGITRSEERLIEYSCEFLKKDGFVLPLRISKQISRAINTLNQEGLYHRDLHWGNVMIVDWNSDNSQTFIIDFGESAFVNNNEALRPSVQQGHLSDVLYAGKYSDLSIRKRAEISEKTLVKMSKNPDWVSSVDDLAIALHLGDAGIQHQFKRSWERLNDKTLFFGMIFAAVQKNPEALNIFQKAGRDFAQSLSLSDSNNLLDFLKSL